MQTPNSNQKRNFQEIHIDRATGNVVEETLQLRTIGEGESQTSVLNFTLASNNFVRDGQQATASYLRVSAFGRDAEILAQYLTKGKPLTVRGRIELKPYQSKKYFDAQGNPAIMHSAELRMEPNGFQFINGGRRQDAQASAGDAQSTAAAVETSAEPVAAASTTSRKRTGSRSRKSASGSSSVVPGPATTVAQPGGPF